VDLWKEHEAINFGGQEVKGQGQTIEAEDKFKSLAKASFATLLHRVTFQACIIIIIIIITIIKTGSKPRGICLQQVFRSLRTALCLRRCCF